MGEYSECFVAFDVAKRKHAVAVAEGGRRGEVRFLGEIENSPATVERVIKKLAARCKTRIVYCKDINRTGDHPDIQFTFLGYTFRPRKVVDKYGRVYVNFTPAVSRKALKAMRQTIRGWHLQLKSDKSLVELSAMFAPILKGWQQYYGRFHGSALKPVWRNMNMFLTRWLMRKHKKLAGHKTRAAQVLRRLAQDQPGAFVHWSLGFLS